MANARGHDTDIKKIDGIETAVAGIPVNVSQLINDSGYITGYTVTQGDVTGHQAALTITESQISDLQAYLTSETTTSIALNGNSLDFTDETGSTTNIDLSAYLDEDSRSIASGTLDSGTGIVTFTRDDASTFTLDLSALLDDTNLVTSVAGKTGVVTLVKADITDFSDGDYATAAQGTLADSSVQPSDNISTLTNDSGFTTYSANQAVDTTSSPTFSTANVTTVDLGNWTITESAGVLYFATGGTNRMKLDASGNLTVSGDVTAFGTV